MGFKFQKIFAFLFVALVASNAGLLPEEYWKSVLPNSPMPSAVKDLLHPTSEWLDDKGTTVGVGKGGVNVNTGRGTNVGVGKGGVNVNTGRGTNVGVGKGGVTVRTNPKGRRRYVYVGPGPDPFQYLYAANQNQVHDDPNVALFFIENDLHAGKTMNLHFSSNIDNEATFLPREVADSIPFSSKMLPQILDKLSVSPSSEEAKVMKKTIQECEANGIKGEEKLCATSLESMIDFSTSKLGRNVEAISTKAEKGDITTLKKYTIAGVKKMPSDKPVVVCHRLEYAYAVFYCHKTETTVAYDVSMVAEDGSKAEAAAVCHRDTAGWNPRHLAFQVLKVKPGTVPVCHFLPEDHVVWVPKY